MSDPAGLTDFEEKRKKMVREIVAHGMNCGSVTGRPDISKKVLQVMLEVPRHLFVLQEYIDRAYDDSPLPIGHGKTVSQPFIVALMVDLLDLTESDRVLEIGTGLGYQSAVVSRLCAAVYTVDIISELTQGAQHIFTAGGYDNIHAKSGNGMLGWEANAPYDKIIVAACGDEVPEALLEQLKPNGRLIMPVGDDENQKLQLLQKGQVGVYTDTILPVLFSRLSAS